MKDWPAIARASGMGLMGKELDKMVQPLDALEEVFRPLTRNLSPDLEPALNFRVEADSE